MVELLPITSNLPLYVSLTFFLAIIFWAKFLSKKEKLIPKTADELISVILLFVFFFSSLFLAIGILIFFLQFYIFGIDLKLILGIISGIMIIGFFIIILNLVSLKKKEAEGILHLIKMLPLSVCIAFLLPFLFVFEFIKTNNLISSIIASIFLSLFLSYIVIMWLYSFLDGILNSKKKKIEIKKMPFKNIFREIFIGWKYLVSFSILIFIFTIFIILSYGSISLEKESAITSYVIRDFSEFDPIAYKHSEVNYSKLIGSSAKRIVIHLDPNKIDLTQKDFQIFLRTMDGENLELFEDRNNITKIIKEGDKLILQFNNQFVFQPFESFLVKGAVKENISSKYSITNPPHKRSWYNKETGNLEINFQINNSLEEPQTHRDLVTHSAWLKGDNLNNCKFKDFYVTLDNARYNCGKNDCVDEECGVQCGTWSIRIIRTEDRIMFRSSNKNETGSLSIKSNLYCKN